MSFTLADRRRWPGTLRRAAAVAGILAASVGGAALLVGGPQPGPRTPEAARTLSGPDPAARPAAGPPAGAPPVLPSPSRVLPVVEVGYRHSTAGAVAAAASYVEAFDSLDLGRAQEWARAVAAPASASALVDQVSRGVAAIRAAAGLPGSGPARGSSVTYQVTAYQVTATAAADRVVVWLLARESATAAGTRTVEQPATLGLPVVWTGGGWRLTAQNLGRPPVRAAAGSAGATANSWRTLTPQAPAPAPAVEAPAAVAAASDRDCGSGVAGLVCHGQRLVAAGLAAVSAPAAAVGAAVGGLAGGLAGSTLAVVARGFGQSAGVLLHQLARVFVASSTIQLSGTGLDRLVSVTAPVAAVVAAVLVVASAGSTAWRQDGSALATALLGLARAALVCVTLVAVVQVCLRASDEVSGWIVSTSFGSEAGLTDRLGATLTAIDVVSPGLLLVVAGTAITLVLLLWAEMLLRHVAVVLLVATSPIAAAGLVCTVTAGWWPRARSALVQLIVLKPVVVLCLAIGYGEFGAARDVNSVIAGLVTLAAAALAWPVLARFMTFTTAGAGSGLVASLGGAMGGRALGALRPALGGPGDRPGAEYPVAAERQNDAVMGVPAVAGPSLAAVTTGVATGGAAAAGILAAQTVASVAHHVGAGVDSMASHADLAPAAPAGSDYASGGAVPGTWQGQQ